MDIVTVDYEKCNCGTSPKCTQSFKGVIVGCYPLEALLQSTIQCFYNQECINLYGNFKALNPLTSSSRFNVNSTVKLILQELMVEEYLINISYENYFTECASTACNRSYIGPRNAIDIATSLIELYGGLTIIIGWIVSLIMEFCRCRTQRQINPHI